MAHYAFLDENNIVTEVIVGVEEDQLIDGLDPEIWYGNFRGQACKRTSFNTYLGEHISGGTPFRKNYAGIGYVYDEIRDAFISPKQFDSWIFDEFACTWRPPVDKPVGFYQWSEEQLNWIPIEGTI